MFAGFAAGIILQIELLKPGISFLDQSIWPHLITLHIGATALSLLIIGLSAISFIRQRETWGLWGIWLGLSIVPILIGALLHLMLKNLPTDNYLSDTLFTTAYLHAFGIAVLLAALGGLSAMNRMKRKIISFKVSFGFAGSIAVAGTILTVIQASAGLNGIARRYIDYPAEFAQLQLFSGISAIACLSLSIAYVVYLWRCPVKTKAAEMF